MIALDRGIGRPVAEFRLRSLACVFDRIKLMSVDSPCIDAIAPALERAVSAGGTGKAAMRPKCKDANLRQYVTGRIWRSGNLFGVGRAYYTT